VLAGLPPDFDEPQTVLAYHADRDIRAPVTPDGLAREVVAAIAAGRVPRKRTRDEKVVLGLVTLAGLLFFARLIAQVVADLAGRGRGVSSTAWDAGLLAGAIAAGASAGAYAFATRKRPLTLRQRRTTLGWTGFLLVQVGTLVPTETGALQFVAFSLGSLAWAEWARLGLRAQPPPTRGWRRWYLLVVALCVLLAAAPWIALAVFAS
jgi:hypothetical protein